MWPLLLPKEVDDHRSDLLMSGSGRLASHCVCVSVSVWVCPCHDRDRWIINGWWMAHSGSNLSLQHLARQIHFICILIWMISFFKKWRTFEGVTAVELKICWNFFFWGKIEQLNCWNDHFCPPPTCLWFFKESAAPLCQKLSNKTRPRPVVAITPLNPFEWRAPKIRLRTLWKNFTKTPKWVVGCAVKRSTLNRRRPFSCHRHVDNTQANSRDE